MAFTWHGPAVAAAVRAHLAGNLDAAGTVIRRRARLLLSVPGPPRSAPGDPPHIDTSALIESIDLVDDAATLTVYVGSDVAYAGHLEIGTPRMAPRPYFVRALIEAGDDAARALVR